MVILCLHYHSLLLAMKVYVVLCPPFSQNLHKRRVDNRSKYEIAQLNGKE